MSTRNKCNKNKLIIVDVLDEYLMNSNQKICTYGIPLGMFSLTTFLNAKQKGPNKDLCFKKNKQVRKNLVLLSWRGSQDLLI